MKTELEVLRKKVKDYDDLFTSKDPAYASLLLKRVIGLLQSDNHLLWKLLQENLGRNWFHKPALDRTLNYKYHIDYEAFDSIVADLNRLMLANNPKDVSRLADTNECMLLGYMAEAFEKQKSYMARELMRKDDKFELSLIADIGQLVMQGNLVTAEDPVNSQYEKRTSQASAGQADIEMSQEGTGNKDAALQGTIKMLVSELRNTREEKNKMFGNFEVLKANFSILEKYLAELTEAAGVAKEGVSMVQMLGKIKKLDPRVLIKNNFSKVLSQGKTEVIAKMATMAIMNINTGVSKATNTTSSYFDDLADNHTDAHDLLVQSRKPKSRIPRDNESYASSTSKQSKQKRVIPSFKGSKNEQVSNFNLKKSLASLSEEDNLMLSRERSANAKGGKYPGLASKGNLSPHREREVKSPVKDKTLLSSMNQITQSFDLTKKPEDMSPDRSESPKKAEPASHQHSGVMKVDQQQANASDISSNSLKKVGVHQVTSQERFSPIMEYKNRDGKEKAVGSSAEKIKKWGQADPRQYKIDKRKITILKSLCIRPQGAASKQHQLSRSNSKHKDDFKVLRSKQATEESLAKIEQNKHQEVASKRDESANQTMWDRRHLYDTEGSQSLLDINQRSKKQSTGLKYQTKRLGNVVKRTHHSTEQTRVSAEDTSVINKNSKREGISQEPAKNIVLESEENTILHSGRDVLATDGSYNKWMTGKNFKAVNRSKENTKNRTYHGGLHKAHIDIEDPYTNAPLQYMDIHREDSSGPRTLTDHMIDTKLDVFDKRRRMARQGSRVDRPIDDSSNSRHPVKFKRNTGQENHWEEPLVNPTGVLCRSS